MIKVRFKHFSLVGICVMAAAMMGSAGIRAQTVAKGTVDRGAVLFKDQGCANCHFIDSRKSKLGPGLQGLFDREALPESGRPVTEANVRKQLIDPYAQMPSFGNKLTEDEINAIVTYLKTL